MARAASTTVENVLGVGFVTTKISHMLALLARR
jgi:hypothetical protein